MYLSFDKQKTAEYLAIIRFREKPNTSKLMAIKETLEKVSDNRCKLVTSSPDTALVFFALKSNLKSSVIRDSLNGGTPFSETACLDDKDSVLVVCITVPCAWRGDDFHKNVHWLLQSYRDE